MKSLQNAFKLDKRDIFTAFLAIIATVSFVPIFTYLYFAQDLTTKDTIMNRNNTGVVLLDRNDQVFFRFYEAKYKTFVPLNQIPKQLQEAVIAAEDKDFYSHPGFSLRSILGAVVADFKHKDLKYGGSTITQQLVKNSLLTANKNFLRKYQELILSQEIERRYTKDEILEMYLNSVYFGEGAFGIQSASNTYFGVSVQNLDLSQSSMLAGLLTAPSELSPISGDANKAKLRQEYVLEQMQEQQKTTPKQAHEALDEKLVFNKNPEQFSFAAPHFALMIKQQLVDKYGEERIARSGFTIKTTLDLDWQAYAEKVVKTQVEALKTSHVSNGAVVVEDPTNGEIKALVGSKDWNDTTFGKFNIATALRPPGSSFKPIVYSAAMEKGLITPATVLHDDPITYNVAGSPPYSPHDYDRRNRGQVLVRRALANSLNIPAVEVMNKLGIPAALEIAQRLGLTSLGDDPSKYGLSLVLGSGEVQLLEMTNVYATLANQGQKNDPTLIQEIKDKSGQVIYKYQPSLTRIIDPEYTFLISSILSDNTTRAETFGNALNISRPAAVKTGTTEDYKDAWTLGYTPHLAIGVWVGNNDNTQMSQIAGSLGAAPIWRSLMEKFLAGTPVEKFTPPANIASVNICRFNGLKVKEATSSGYTEYFIKGSEPTAYCFIPKPSSSPSGSSNPSPPQSTPNSPAPTPQVITIPQGGDQTIIIDQNGQTTIIKGKKKD